MTKMVFSTHFMLPTSFTAGMAIRIISKFTSQVVQFFTGPGLDCRSHLFLQKWLVRNTKRQTISRLMIKITTNVSYLSLNNTLKHIKSFKFNNNCLEKITTYHKCYYHRLNKAKIASSSVIFLSLN